MIAELVVNMFNGQFEKAEAIGAKYRQMHNGEMISNDNPWPNRLGGRVATVQAGTHRASTHWASTHWAGIKEAAYWGSFIIGFSLVALCQFIVVAGIIKLFR